MDSSNEVQIQMNSSRLQHIFDSYYINCSILVEVEDIHRPLPVVEATLSNGQVVSEKDFATYPERLFRPLKYKVDGKNICVWLLCDSPIQTATVAVGNGTFRTVSVKELTPIFLVFLGEDASEDSGQLYFRSDMGSETFRRLTFDEIMN